MTKAESPTPNRRRPVIAIDGPAGVGKSTVGKLVAQELGFHFVNSGEMYRALAWKAIEDGVPRGDADALEALARRIRWEFKPDGATLRTFVDGTLVGGQIRSEEVSKASSLVAAAPGVRRYFRHVQRELGEQGGIVMEGRDITTNVFPDAEFKFYLDATAEERARRRYKQLKASGAAADHDAILDAIRRRDTQDSERKINPLRRAPDAVVIDSTRLTLHEVADAILKHVGERWAVGGNRTEPRSPLTDHRR